MYFFTLVAHKQSQDTQLSVIILTTRSSIQEKPSSCGTFRYATASFFSLSDLPTVSCQAAASPRKSEHWALRDNRQWKCFLRQVYGKITGKKRKGGSNKEYKSPSLDNFFWEKWTVVWKLLPHSQKLLLLFFFLSQPATVPFSYLYRYMVNCSCYKDTQLILSV